MCAFAFPDPRPARDDTPIDAAGDSKTDSTIAVGISATAVPVSRDVTGSPGALLAIRRGSAKDGERRRPERKTHGDDLETDGAGRAGEARGIADTPFGYRPYDLTETRTVKPLRSRESAGINVTDPPPDAMSDLPRPDPFRRSAAIGTVIRRNRPKLAPRCHIRHSRSPVKRVGAPPSVDRHPCPAGSNPSDDHRPATSVHPCPRIDESRHHRPREHVAANRPGDMTPTPASGRHFTDGTGNGAGERPVSRWLAALTGNVPDASAQRSGKTGRP